MNDHTRIVQAPAEPGSRSAIRSLVEVSGLADQLARTLDDFSSARRSWTQANTSAETLDGLLRKQLLLTQPTDHWDAVVLAIGAQDAMASIWQNLFAETPFADLGDAVQQALQNLAGYLLLSIGPDAVASLPEAMREGAQDYVDNFTGVAAPDAERVAVAA